MQFPRPWKLQIGLSAAHGDRLGASRKRAPGTTDKSIFPGTGHRADLPFDAGDTSAKPELPGERTLAK
jgi:hypothetical protein